MRLSQLALFSIVALTAACADRASDSSVGEPGGTVVIAAAGTGSSPMFPPYAADAVGRLGADNMYERLAEIGPELNTVGDRGFSPRLARSWEWSRDSLSIAFAIDPRARWHDGQPVRATDVRFTFDLLKDPKSAAVVTSLLENIDSVSVRDSLTAVAWFKRRTPEQFFDFAHHVRLLPQHVLKDIPRDKLATSDAIRRPMGSGKFRLASYEPGVRVELVADTAHYRGRPKLDRVIVSFVTDAGVAITQLFSGQADFTEIIPPDALSRVDTTGNVRAVPYPGLQYIYFGMNQRDARRVSAPHPLFTDRTVRLAISMALDRQAMLRNVYDTLGVLGVGPSPAARMDSALALPPFDRARAAALLDSAGWRAGAGGMRSKNGRPLAFGLIVPTSSQPRMRYAVLIQEQLRAIGVHVDIESMDFNAFYDRTIRGAFDATLNGVGTGPSPLAAGRQGWSAAGFSPEGQNWLRYSNRRFEALLDSAERSFDPARVAHYRQRAMQTVADDVPAVWLYDVLTIAGVHKRLRTEGMRADAWWSGLAEWWIPANERIERDRIGLRPTQP